MSFQSINFTGGGIQFAIQSLHHLLSCRPFTVNFESQGGCQFFGAIEILSYRQRQVDHLLVEFRSLKFPTMPFDGILSGGIDAVVSLADQHDGIQAQQPRFLQATPSATSAASSLSRSITLRKSGSRRLVSGILPLGVDAHHHYPEVCRPVDARA